MNNDPDEITLWLEQLKQGDSQAVEQIFERYFSQLVRLAQRRMAELPRRTSDEEDVALSAMNSFIKGARSQKFPRLEDQSDLWRLLVTITARKANAHRRRYFAERRGGGAVRGESVFQTPDDGDAQPGLMAVLGNEPTPQFAAQMAEECRALFDKLDDPALRDIAGWKMEGFSNEEIAKKLGRSVRAVERKLALIRDCWRDSAEAI